MAEEQDWFDQYRTSPAPAADDWFNQFKTGNQTKPTAKPKPPVIESAVKPEDQPGYTAAMQAAIQKAKKGEISGKGEGTQTEPDTWWGGFSKGLSDYAGDIGNQLFEAYSHPKNLMDIIGLATATGGIGTAGQVAGAARAAEPVTGPISRALEPITTPIGKAIQ